MVGLFYQRRKKTIVGLRENEMRRKNATATETGLLPDEIIEDILFRLPVKSLVRFKTVCKSWYDLLNNPGFVNMHLKRSLAKDYFENLVFIADRSFYSVDLDASNKQLRLTHDHQSDILECSSMIWGSCNGLFCVSDNSYFHAFLWNPSTRSHLNLPITPLGDEDNDVEIHSYGFGYEPTTADYKVVRIEQVLEDSSDENYPPPQVKIYSLNTNSWRRLEDLPFHLFYPGQYSVLANSSLHWIVHRHDHEEPDSRCPMIGSFHLQLETYGEIQLPPGPGLKDICDVDIVMDVLQEQLCVLRTISSSRVEIWVMKEYGVSDSWVKQFLIYTRRRDCWDYLRPISYSKNGGVLLKQDPFKLHALFDPSCQRITNLQIVAAILEKEAENEDEVEKKRKMSHGMLVTCVGSLVPLNAKKLNT